jgi:hypothetical protein
LLLQGAGLAHLPDWQAPDVPLAGRDCCRSLACRRCPSTRLWPPSCPGVRGSRLLEGARRARHGCVGIGWHAGPRTTWKKTIA